MNEKLLGVVARVNDFEVHFALSMNCFNFGFEMYTGRFRLNFGPISIMFGRW